MFSLKSGVKLMGVKPEMVIAMQICHAIYAKYDIEMVITSITDSKHSTFSRHYLGYAFDLRTKNIPSEAVKTAILHEIKESLTKDFLVLDEGTHFHIGFKPQYA